MARDALLISRACHVINDAKVRVKVLITQQRADTHTPDFGHLCGRVPSMRRSHTLRFFMTCTWTRRLLPVCWGIGISYMHVSGWFRRSCSTRTRSRRWEMSTFCQARKPYDSSRSHSPMACRVGRDPFFPGRRISAFRLAGRLAL